MAQAYVPLSCAPGTARFLQPAGRQPIQLAACRGRPRRGFRRQFALAVAAHEPLLQPDPRPVAATMPTSNPQVNASFCPPKLAADASQNGQPLPRPMGKGGRRSRRTSRSNELTKYPQCDVSRHQNCAGSGCADSGHRNLVNPRAGGVGLLGAQEGVIPQKRSSPCRRMYRWVRTADGLGAEGGLGTGYPRTTPTGGSTRVIRTAGWRDSAPAPPSPHLQGWAAVMKLP